MSAQVCQACGASNEPSATACRVCGRALSREAAAAAAGLPTPAGYPSPSYVVGLPVAPEAVHRTSWTNLLGLVAALVLVLTAGGIGVALIAGHFAGNGQTAGIAGSSNQGSSSRLATFVPQGQTESNAALSVVLPPGWSVSAVNGETITLTDPDGTGSLTVGSGRSSQAQSAQQNRDAIDRYYEGKYPDTAPCPGSQDAPGILNGADGLFWTLCFTVTTGAQSFPGACALFSGATSDGGVYYLVEELTARDNLQNFVAEAAPVVESIHWNLS